MMEIFDEHASAPRNLHEFASSGNSVGKENYEFGAEIVASELARNENDNGEVATKTNSTKTTTTVEVDDTTNLLQLNENTLDVSLKQQCANTKATAAATAEMELQRSSDDSTSDSNFSDLSGLSDVSGQDWKPRAARPINWVQQQINSGANPRELISQMFSFSAPQISPSLNDMALWRLLINMLSEPPRRKKLEHINTFEDVLQLVRTSKQIIVLTGAGVSVSCGIPDFRSSDGIYARLAKDYPDLPDPQAMFDINYFMRDPRPFFKFAREIYPGQFKPSPCHQFIHLLEKKGKLLRNYTQNIDTLEQVEGIQNVIECHGSFSTASCTKCKHKCTADDIRADIFAQRIPVCPMCQPHVLQSVDAAEPVCVEDLAQLVANGIMKPDIVFFGEGLPERFHTVMSSDKDNCDLLIVIGSSLKVRPVALIPSSIPSHVPQILINREHLGHLEFDVELLGDSDVIINQLCHCLGDDWQQICYSEQILQECNDLLPIDGQLASHDISSSNDTTIARLQDVDTQSLKSNASTDIGLRSDSGFESSTSSGMVMGGKSNNTVGLGPHSGGSSSASVEAADAMHKIKSSVFELKKPLLKSIDLLSPEFLNEHNDAVDYQNFNNMTAVERHISSDSTTKDSGIQCEATNSKDTTLSKGNFNVNSETTTATTTTASNNLELTKSTTTECGAKIRLSKRGSVAERLPAGCYLYPAGGSAYIFPGAVVSWSSDSDEEEEEEEEDDEEEEEEEEDEEEELDEEEEDMADSAAEDYYNAMLMVNEDNAETDDAQQCCNIKNINAKENDDDTLQTITKSTTNCKRSATESTEELAATEPPNKRLQRSSLSINLENVATTKFQKELLEAANSNRDNPIGDTGSTELELTAATANN